MKWKKIILIFGLVLTILFVFRSWIFKLSTNYSPSGERNLIELSDQKLIQEIENWKSEKKQITIDEAIKFSLKFTAQKLNFSTNRGLNSDPNKISDSGLSNCVGYSRLFNSVSNYIFENTANLKPYKSSHLIGEITFLGINLHKLTDDPFWRDHDYNRIINLETQKEYFVDPSVLDYFRITYIQ